MTKAQLVWRQISARPLGSLLTIASVALGVMLVIAILNLRRDLADHYDRPGRGYSIVCGPHGSPLQLVLNAVYHVDESPGLMPYSAWKELAANESVRLAVPYAVGDSFRGHRVVATTEAVFHPAFPVPDSPATDGKFQAGRGFVVDAHALEHAIEDIKAAALGEGSHEHHHHENDVAEAVLGARVARRLKLTLGDQIEPTHGVEGEKAHDHAHLWTVVGILKETDTPIDDVVLINLDSFFRIPEHAGGLIPGTTEVGLSAVLVFPRPGIHKALLLSSLKKRQEFSTAEVSSEIRKFLGIIGGVDGAFLIVALLVVLIGVTSVLVAVWNTMNERRREIAILRALGASRATITGSVVAEAMILVGLGGILGVAMAHGGLWLAADAIKDVAKFEPNPLRILPAEYAVVFGTILAGALAGLIPAIKAYRTDVAENLAPVS
jgi:putative ABC transport system permease protein